MSEQGSEPNVVRVGILGCGNVGAPLVELIRQRRDDIEATTGIGLEVVSVAVRNPSKRREPGIDADLLTTDAMSVVDDPSIHVIVEVIGGIEPARSLIMAALQSGKPVITGNKELLANVGNELYRAAELAGVDLLFEAAVGGAIPIVRPMRESLLGEKISRITGIMNGTTNFILTRMSEDGASYGDALTEAQQRGYAERDPTADVEGFDAGAKAAILASIAFDASVVAGDVYHEGISGITQEDIAFARHFGYTIKLLATAERFGEGQDTEVGVTVHPAMVANAHPLAAVRDSFNAVFVQGAAAGDLMFYGRGAGGYPTASAVLGDLIDAASNLRRNTFRPVPSGSRARIRPVDELSSAYYISAEVADTPGVLASVAEVLGNHGVSIRSMEQQVIDDDPSRGGAPEAHLAFITHMARERDVRSTLAEIRELESVVSVQSVLRVVEA